MNVNLYNTVDYENIANCKLGENKANTNPIKANTKPIKANQSQNKPNTNPKQTQSNPISKKPKMNVSSVLTKDYENERLCRRGENKPNQTQFQRQKNAGFSTRLFGLQAASQCGSVVI